MFSGGGGAYGGASTNGWTIVNPTDPFGEGSGFSGAGTRKIFVSSSTGNDGNTGTLASPYATIGKAVTFLRNNSPDQLFLKCGDTWTIDSTTDLGFNNISATSGAAKGSVGHVCTGPLLVSSYGTGARPIVQINSVSANQIAIGQSGTDLFAIIGIEFYAHKRDPANAGYSYSEALTNVDGVRFTNALTWVLVEDCWVHHFHINMDFEPSSAATGSINFNRVIDTDSYSLTAHSQGVLCNPGGGIGPYNPNTLVINECFFDRNGWNSALFAPASVSIVQATGVFTWPSTPKFGNGALLTASTSGGGLTAYTTQYFVIGLSGNTFQLSATLSGPAITLSAGLVTPQNMTWIDPSPTQFNRNLYLDCPLTINRSISARSSAEGAEFRSGGTIFNNLFVDCTDGFDVGHTGDSFGAISNSSATYNVVLESKDLADPNLGTVVVNGVMVRGTGQGINITNANTSSVKVNNNLVCNVNPNSLTTVQYAIQINSDCNGVDASGNIIFKWSTGVNDQGTGNITTQTIVDTAGNNTGGAPEPFFAPTRTIESYSTSLGGLGTLDDFMNQCRLQRNGSWRPEYTATAANNYMRVGYNLPNV